MRKNNYQQYLIGNIEYVIYSLNEAKKLRLKFAKKNKYQVKSIKFRINVAQITQVTFNTIFVNQ